MVKKMFFTIIAAMMVVGSSMPSFGQETVATFAQTTVIQLRTELVSPWLVTVEGDARARILKILDLGERSEGTFLVDATYGWIDGAQSPVRAEIAQSETERRLRITTPPGSVIVATQSADGSFTGTFTPKTGTAKAVRLEKFSEREIAAEDSTHNWVEGIWEDQRVGLVVKIKVLKDDRLSGAAWMPKYNSLEGTIQEGTISGNGIHFKISFIWVKEDYIGGLGFRNYEFRRMQNGALTGTDNYGVKYLLRKK